MLDKLTIGIIGGGVVGSALARAHVEFVKEVKIYDIKPERSTHRLHEAVCDSDLIFVCLPTPQRKRINQEEANKEIMGGPPTILGHDVSALNEFFSHMGGLLHNRNFVIKSTVPVGYTRLIAEKYQLTNLVHSPEFLTARCALHDAMIPSRNVIGVPDLRYGHGSRTSQFRNECATLLADFYMKRHPGIKIHCVTSDNSEAAKLFCNAYFAAKVSLFNEFQAHCAANKLNWYGIRSIMVSDPRIEVTHTQIPGQFGRYGFGGECLPKDLDELLLEMGENATVLSAVQRRNEQIDLVRNDEPKRTR